MPARRTSKGADKAKRTPPAASNSSAASNKPAIKHSLPASKKRKRQPVSQPAEEAEDEDVEEKNEDDDATGAVPAVKEEVKRAEHSDGIGSSREQQIELDEDEGEEEDDLSLASSDIEDDALLKEEAEEDANAPFDELLLPLRVYIGTYTGSLYALESVHSLHHMLTSPPLPPAEPHSSTSTASRAASSFYTLFNTDAHRASIHAVACSPHGSHLVSSGVDEVVQLYRLEGERRHVGSLHRHYASVNQLLFPSSHTFLSASDDGTVAVFSSVHQWEMVKRLSSTGTAGVVSMSLHPSHRVLLTSSSDGVVRMWDMVRGVEATRRRVKFDHPSVTEGGSGQSREEVRVQWEETGNGYVMVRGKTLTVYDEQGAVHRVVHSDSRILSFHFIAPSLLIAGCDDCSLRCWDAHTGEQLWMQKQHTARVRCLDYLRLSDQQLLIVSASTDGQVSVWRGGREGVRAGVERVGGAKSEARITALCCGVRWDARRPQKDSSATTAAEQKNEAEAEGMGEEEKKVALEAEVAASVRDRSKNGGKGNETSHSKKPAKKQRTPATNKQRRSGVEKRTAAAMNSKQRARGGDGQQTSQPAGRGSEKEVGEKRTKGVVSIVNHKRRAR